MPPCGTFDYAVVIPGRPWDSECVAETRGARPPVRGGDQSIDARLVGYSPTVKVSDGRITLTAPRKRLATVRTASINIRAELTALLSAGDVLHLVRSACGGLAVGVLSRGELIFAIGAVQNLPLGGVVDVRLASAAARPGVPFWEMKEVPVEVTVSGITRRLGATRTVRLGEYDVHVEHGFLPGIPGRDESLAIARVDRCPLEPAVDSARLLDSQAGREIVQW